MTNREAIEKCTYANLLSFSSQIGLLSSIHLRKNESQVSSKIRTDIEEIKKVGEEKNAKSKEKAEYKEGKDPISLATAELLDKEFEGNFFMLSVEEIGNIKGELIPLTNNNKVDAKWLAEQLIGSIIIVPEEAKL